MKKKYKCRVPQTLYFSEQKSKMYLEWIDEFTTELSSLFAEEIRKRFNFTDSDFDTSRDDFNYAFEFRRKDTYFVMDFGFRSEDEEAVNFETMVNVIILKKFRFFHRKREPPKELFEEFNSAFLEIAKQNNIEVVL